MLSHLDPVNEQDIDKSNEDVDHSAQQENEVPMVLAAKENRAVNILRFLTLVVFGLAAALAATLVGTYARGQELEDFERTFYNEATAALVAYRSNAQARYEVLVQFGSSMTEFALKSGNGKKITPASSAFPYVTVPDFERRALFTLRRAEVLGVFFQPKVLEEERANWTEYANANQAWISQSLASQEEVKGSFEENKQLQPNSNNKVEPIVPYLYTLDESGCETNTTAVNYSFPIWQMAPVVDRLGIVNFDMYTAEKALFDTILSTRRPLISDSTVLPVGNGGQGEIESKQESGNDVNDGLYDDNEVWVENTVGAAYRYLIDAFLEKTGDGTVSAGGPAATIYLPVFDKWNKERREVAGVLSALVYWQRYLDDLLPDTTNFPLVAVLESSCDNQTFSYEIRGPNSTYLGEGDHHDPQFDYMEFNSGYGAEFGLADDVADLTQSSDHRLCAYNLRISPTQDMHDSFKSNEPWVFVGVILLIFLFTLLMFCCYDYLNRRRHRIVNDKAKEQTAVVSSLFPEAVRQQVVGIVDSKNTGDGFGGGTDTGFLSNVCNKNGHESPMSALLHDDPHERLAQQLDSSAPIANLYPDCTVLFCDIAGFTSWSSKRAPTEVFKLLEAMYGAFDRIAQKKGVFKVETIGDCYVAVTGLPHPQKKHAIIMARFAADCMAALSGMMHVLVDKLGSDTGDLCMRFGLHSGPVTAGVLRGRAARFQLFGDSVNTAARMESNGQKGRIQCSQSTADLLIAGGKGHWVEARPDKIQAKGKGELQTYWITIGTMTASVLSGSHAETLASTAITESDESVPVPVAANPHFVFSPHP